MKKCSRKLCAMKGQPQFVLEFNKDKSTKDGLNSWCRACVHQHRVDHLQERREYSRKYEAEHVEQRTKYNEEHREEISAQKKHIRKTDPDRAREPGRQHYQRNKEAVKARTAEYSREKRKEDPMFRLAGYLREKIRITLKQKSLSKTSKLSEYLGCTLEQLKAHLESQFKPGMTWNNHTTDGWHVDHIIPMSSASTSEEAYQLQHYTNLQPLWAKDNLSKGDRII